MGWHDESNRRFSLCMPNRLKRYKIRFEYHINHRFYWTDKQPVYFVCSDVAQSGKRGSTAGRSSSSPKHGVVELVADMNYVSLIFTATLIERYTIHNAWILDFADRVVLSVGQAVHFPSKIEFKCDKNSRSWAFLTSRYIKIHFRWSWYTMSLAEVMYEKSDVPPFHHQSIDSDVLKSF